MDYDDFEEFDYDDSEEFDWVCIVCSEVIPNHSEFELCEECKEHYLEKLYGNQTPCRFCGEPLGHLESYDDFHIECWRPE